MTHHKKMTMKEFEKTPYDKRADVQNARKHNMTLAEWQASKLDKTMDKAALKKMNACTGKRGCRCPSCRP